MDTRATFLDAVSEGRDSGWRSVGGALAVYAIWQAAGYAGMFATGALALAVRLPAVYDAMLRLWGVSWASLGILGGLWLVQRGIHGRTLRSLVTAGPRVAWRRMAAAAGVWAAVLAVSEGLAALLEPGAYRLAFQPVPFLASLVALVPLIALQAAGEELFFRGYLIQAMARYTRVRWVLVAAGAVLFALPHLGNPEVASGGWLVMSSYALMGGFLAAVVLRDGGLELAIGLHVINNVAAAVLVGSPASVISGTAPLLTTAQSPPVVTLAVTAAQVAVFWAVVFRHRRQSEAVMTGAADHASPPDRQDAT